jgi:hypothetical protein
MRDRELEARVWDEKSLVSTVDERKGDRLCETWSLRKLLWAWMIGEMLRMKGKACPKVDVEEKKVNRIGPIFGLWVNLNFVWQRRCWKQIV